MYSGGAPSRADGVCQAATFEYNTFVVERADARSDHFQRIDNLLRPSSLKALKQRYAYVSAAPNLPIARRIRRWTCYCGLS
jgi:hypothetical protein